MKLKDIGMAVLGVIVVAGAAMASENTTHKEPGSLAQDKIRFLFNNSQKVFCSESKYEIAKDIYDVAKSSDDPETKRLAVKALTGISERVYTIDVKRRISDLVKNL